jgi:hypothetical protein
MDNDTNKILLLIARALQVNALAQLANVGVYGGDGVALQTNSLAQAATAHRFDVWREDIKKERVMADALFAKINNEGEYREAQEKLMDEIRMDETWSRVSKAQEELMDQVQMDELQKLLWSKVGNQEKNNA